MVGGRCRLAEPGILFTPGEDGRHEGSARQSCSLQIRHEMPNLQGMVPRHMTKILADALARQPAVALLGPRQVGKTTLACQIAESSKGAVYLDLERAA
jgi:MoxR-like ATPase